MCDFSAKKELLLKIKGPVSALRPLQRVHTGHFIHISHIGLVETL